MPPIWSLCGAAKVRARAKVSKCGAHCVLAHEHPVYGKSRNPHFSYSLAARVQAWGLVFTNQTGHRRGQGSPFQTRALCKRGTILAFSPSPRPKQQVRQAVWFFCKNSPTVPFGSFPGSITCEPDAWPSQKFCEPPNYCPLIHPFLLKVARGISAVCSQKPCCWAPQRREQRNERKLEGQWKPPGTGRAASTRAKSGASTPSAVCPVRPHGVTHGTRALVEGTWVEILTPLPNLSIMVGKFLILSKPQFTHPQNGNNALPPYRLVQRIKLIIHINSLAQCLLTITCSRKNTAIAPYLYQLVWLTC